jgi:hypothetical protein
MPVKTRSQTKNIKNNYEEENTNLLKQEREEDEEHEEDEEEEVLPEIVTLEELTNRGLTPNSKIKYRKIVVNALELDFLITAINYDKLKNKYALAPDGYYWKEFSEKNYYHFDWYELKPIPYKRKTKK